MRHFYRCITVSTFLLASPLHAWDVFVDAIDWRPTETNNWVYINSQTLPNQTLTYKTIDFSYTPGYRIGATYTGPIDVLLAYTHLNAATNDSTAGGYLQPSFLGSVTAKPSAAYLYSAGQVRQTINYSVIDVNIGHAFTPAPSIQLHPIAGLMIGRINQSIFASYYGSTTSHEKIINDFTGFGPKLGIDTGISLFHYHDYEPKLMAAFAASYLVGDWDVSDVARVTPTHQVIISGASHTMGALTLQALAGIKLDYHQLSVKLAYEWSDWFNQVQFFDNDTGAHNNDLILQGLTLGITYRL